jgi:hypothetical protein
MNANNVTHATERGQFEGARAGNISDLAEGVSLGLIGGLSHDRA